MSRIGEATRQVSQVATHLRHHYLDMHTSIHMCTSSVFRAHRTVLGHRNRCFGLTRSHTKHHPTSLFRPTHHTNPIRAPRPTRNITSAHLHHHHIPISPASNPQPPRPPQNVLPPHRRALPRPLTHPNSRLLINTHFSRRRPREPLRSPEWMAVWG